MMRVAILIAGAALFWGGVIAAQDGFTPVAQFRVEVLSEYPHDTNAFTQGLLYHEGVFYESTGRYQQSTLRMVEPETGEVQRRYDLPDEVFAEGLALVDDRLYQITWREQVAVVYDLEIGLEDDTFEPEGVFQYNGEGWGLCYDGELLYMSDGSSRITVRDPDTFQPVGVITVTLYGVFVDELNELECVGDDIYANVWNSNTILRLDKSTGEVNGVIDAAGLLTEEELSEMESGAVLNGIAYNAEEDVFYITGKLWSKLFEVQFVPVEEE